MKKETPEQKPNECVKKKTVLRDITPDKLTFVMGGMAITNGYKRF